MVIAAMTVAFSPTQLESGSPTDAMARLLNSREIWAKRIWFLKSSNKTYLDASRIALPLIMRPTCRSSIGIAHFNRYRTSHFA